MEMKKSKRQNVQTSKLYKTVVFKFVENNNKKQKQKEIL